MFIIVLAIIVLCFLSNETAKNSQHVLMCVVYYSVQNLYPVLTILNSC